MLELDNLGPGLVEDFCHIPVEDSRDGDPPEVWGLLELRASLGLHQAFLRSSLSHSHPFPPPLRVLCSSLHQPLAHRIQDRAGRPAQRGPGDRKHFCVVNYRYLVVESPL